MGNIHVFAMDVSFCSLISPCPLPIKSLRSIPKLVEIYFVETLVSSVSPNLKIGAWKATLATQITEVDLNFPKIRWLLHLGRSGFGNVKPTHVLEGGSQAHHKLVTKTHCETEEEHTLERVQQLQLHTMPLGAMPRLHRKQFYMENYLGNTA